MKTFIKTVLYMQKFGEEYRSRLEVLAYIQSRHDAALETKITDVVYERVYGTGPTVHTKIKGLHDLGYLLITKSLKDARTKILTVSPTGRKLLNMIDNELKEAIR